MSILNKKRQRITSYLVEVRGERRDNEPRNLKYIQIKHVIRRFNVSEKAVLQAIALSDKKYCSVAATLRPTAEIVTSYEIVKDCLP
jgi:putative redox protein